MLLLLFILVFNKSQIQAEEQDTYIEEELISVNNSCEHNICEDIIPATLSSDGYITKSCSLCDYIKIIPIYRPVVSISSENVFYTGNNILPVINVNDIKKNPISNDDYIISISDLSGHVLVEDINAQDIFEVGDYKVILSFKEDDSHRNYKGTKSFLFHVLPRNIGSQNFEVSVAPVSYGYGERMKPSIQIHDLGIFTESNEYYTLIENVDYVLEFSNNIQSGTGDVTIIGKGRYSGIRHERFNITQPVFNSDSIFVKALDGQYKSVLPNQTVEELDYQYTGSPVCPEIKITIPTDEAINSLELIRNQDYIVTYKNNTLSYNFNKNDAGFKAKYSPFITITGIGNYKTSGSFTFYFTIKPADLKDTTTVDQYVNYSGKNVKCNPPLATPKGQLLKINKDYFVEGYCLCRPDDLNNTDLDRNNYDPYTDGVITKESGNYVVVCKGIGNYSGSYKLIHLTICMPSEIAIGNCKFSIPDITFNTIGNMPEQDKIIVTYGKRRLIGYWAKNATNDTEANEEYENALSSANQNDVERLLSCNYIYYIDAPESVGTGSLHFLAITNRGYKGKTTKTYHVKGRNIGKCRINNYLPVMTYSDCYLKQNFDTCIDPQILTNQSTVYLSYPVSKNNYDFLVYNPNNPFDATNDYFITYQYLKGKNAGKVYVSINGNPSKGYTGSITKSFNVVPKVLSNNEINTIKSQIIIDGQIPFKAIPNESYTGSECCPRPNIKYINNHQGSQITHELVEGEDYVITYQNNIKCGTVIDKKAPTLILKGKNNFKGSITLKFNILLNREGHSNNLYVSTQGNDLNSGTIEHPLRTIQAAIEQASPGTTIYIRSGNYYGCYSFVRSGNAEQYITVTNFPGESPILLLPAKKSNEYLSVFSLNGFDYIRIKGLKIGNSTNSRVCGIYITKGSHHIEILDNEIFKLKTSYPNNGGMGECNAILLSGEGISDSDDETIRDILISDNYIHNNVNGWSENISVTGNCSNVKILENIVGDNTNIGIDLYGNNDDEGYCQIPFYNRPRDCQVIGNRIYRCKSKYAECAGIYVDGAYDIEIYDNEVYQNMYGIEVGSEEWRDYYDSYKFNGKDIDLSVHNINVSGNYIHNNPAGGIRIGGYTGDGDDAYEDGVIKLTGLVKSCSIINNKLYNNGEGESGYNGEINFSKCDFITVSNNLIIQSKDLYPVFEFGLDPKYSTNIDISVGNKRNGRPITSF